jgi:hypothetical protein
MSGCEALRGHVVNLPLAPLCGPKADTPLAHSSWVRTYEHGLFRSTNADRCLMQSFEGIFHSQSPTHPHFVRVSALRATTGFDRDRIIFRSETSNDPSQRVRKRLSDTLRPLRRSDPEFVRVTASDTSDQRTTIVVGTGSAVSPVYLCLSARSW